LDAIKAYNSLGSQNERSAIVFYRFSGDTLYTWGITERGVEYLSYEKMNETFLADLEFELKNTISINSVRGAETENIKEGHTADMDSLSRKLGDILFPSALLNSLSEYEHLIIVPCLNIASIPLYALKLSNAEYLVDLKTLTVAHSLDDVYFKIKRFVNSNRNDPSSLRKLVVESPLLVGNPSFRGCEEQYQQLPGAENEIRSVASKFKGKPLTGSAAKKSTIQSTIRKSDLIYFATHGFADVIDPINGSYLLLSGEKNSLCEKLTAKEIQFDSIKPGTLVVLSACQTGLGRALNAGVIGLGRSFLKAGAGNVVMSLWNIGDKETNEFMDIFTDELFVEKQILSSKSLRVAILKYKELNPNVSAWAAFMAMGLPFSGKSAYLIR
jgi:CHAT domain-containing protein